MHSWYPNICHIYIPEKSCASLLHISETIPLVLYTNSWSFYHLLLSNLTPCIFVDNEVYVWDLNFSLTFEVFLNYQSNSPIAVALDKITGTLFWSCFAKSSAM